MLPLLFVILGQFAVIVYTMAAYARDRQQFLDTINNQHYSGISERSDLLQRIQAPEIAVVSHAQRTAMDDPPTLPYDDDDAFRKLQDELMGGPSRDDMVAALLEGDE